MCITPKPNIPKAPDVPAPPPPPEQSPVAPVIPAAKKADETKSLRKGTSALRIKLNIAQPGGSGVQTPGA
jgi:hypothetical protein